MLEQVRGAAVEDHAGQHVAHEDEIRHVDDADEQDEERAAPHQIEDRLHVADEKVLHRRDDGVEPRVGEELGVLREALEVSGVDGVDLLLRLLHRRAGLEASDVAPVVAVALLVALLLGGKRGRQPQLNLWLREGEVPGHDADDRVGLAVDPEVPAGDLRIAAERRLPERVAQDDLLLVADFAFFVRERATEPGGMPTSRKNDGVANMASTRVGVPFWSIETLRVLKSACSS